MNYSRHVENIRIAARAQFDLCVFDDDGEPQEPTPDNRRVSHVLNPNKVRVTHYKNDFIYSITHYRPELRNPDDAMAFNGLYNWIKLDVTCPSEEESEYLNLTFARPEIRMTSVLCHCVDLVAKTITLTIPWATLVYGYDHGDPNDPESESEYWLKDVIPEKSMDETALTLGLERLRRLFHLSVFWNDENRPSGANYRVELYKEGETQFNVEDRVHVFYDSKSFSNILKLMALEDGVGRFIAKMEVNPNASFDRIDMRHKFSEADNR